MTMKLDKENETSVVCRLQLNCKNNHGNIIKDVQRTIIYENPTLVPALQGLTMICFLVLVGLPGQLLHEIKL
jgi:hypothetical protein